MSDSEEGPYEEDSGGKEERGWSEEFEMKVPWREKEGAGARRERSASEGSFGDETMA